MRKKTKDFPAKQEGRRDGIRAAGKRKNRPGLRGSPGDFSRGFVYPEEGREQALKRPQKDRSAAGRADALPLDQGRGNDHFQGQGIRPQGYPAAQQVHGQVAHLFHMGADAGKGRVGEGAENGIVEADDGKVLGNPDAGGPGTTSRPFILASPPFRPYLNRC